MFDGPASLLVANLMPESACCTGSGPPSSACICAINAAFPVNCDVLEGDGMPPDSLGGGELDIRVMAWPGSEEYTVFVPG
jgi:hypothetical protein